MTGRSATEQWYSEIKDFDFGNKVFNHKIGHFSQVVWKESIEVGAGIAVSKDGWNFCVARYSAAGNLKGAFDKNIGNLSQQAQDKKTMDKLREEVINLFSFSYLKFRENHVWDADWLGV